MECYFEVMGRAVPWKVPVVVKGRKKAVKSRSLRSWQDTISLFARIAMNGKPPVSVPVRIDVEIFMKTKQKSNPDTTNLLKAIEDSIQGVCIINDSQVREISVIKRESETEKVLVRVTGLELFL